MSGAPQSSNTYSDEHVFNYRPPAAKPEAVVALSRRLKAEGADDILEALGFTEYIGLVSLVRNSRLRATRRAAIWREDGTWIGPGDDVEEQGEQGEVRRPKVVWPEIAIECPRCGAPVGQTCKTPSGREATKSHAKRLDQWLARPRDEDAGT